MKEMAPILKTGRGQERNPWFWWPFTRFYVFPFKVKHMYGTTSARQTAKLKVQLESLKIWHTYTLATLLKSTTIIFIECVGSVPHIRFYVTRPTTFLAPLHFPCMCGSVVNTAKPASQKNLGLGSSAYKFKNYVKSHDNRGRRRMSNITSKTSSIQEKGVLRSWQGLSQSRNHSRFVNPKSSQQCARPNSICSMREFRLPPRYKLGLRSSAMLCSVD